MSEGLDYSSLEREKSKSASVKDGVLSSAMIGIGESFVVPFALFLGVPGGIVGLLQPFCKFFGSLMQIFTLPFVSGIKSKRKFIFIGVIFQAFIWAFFSLIAFFMIGIDQVISLIFALFALNYISTYVTNPPWAAWMADIVPECERGVYFAKRNKYGIIFMVIAMLFGGWLLDKLSFDKSLGFAILFALAFLIRLISSKFIWDMHEVKSEQNEDHQYHVKLGEIIFNPAFKDEKLFIFYIFFIMAGTYICSPFLDIYMLSTLGFSYVTWSIIRFAGTFSKPLALPYWGKLIDRFGNRPVLYVTGLLIPLIPIFWIFSKDPHILFFFEVFSGIAWGGFELAAFNYTISSRNPAFRTVQTAAYNFSNTFGMFAGALVGAAIFTLWPVSAPIEVFIGMFAISGIARYVASLYFLPKFSAKSFAPISSSEFLWQVMLAQPQREMRQAAGLFVASGYHMASSGISISRRAIKNGVEVTLEMIKRKRRR
ncbi:MAG: MFS transporter [Candidatus Micrarchaeia archaeon]